jgi:hypothetical protein
MFTQTTVGSQSFSAVDTRPDQGMKPIWPHAQNPLVRVCARVRALIRGCVRGCPCVREDAFVGVSVRERESSSMCQVCARVIPGVRLCSCRNSWLCVVVRVPGCVRNCVCVFAFVLRQRYCHIQRLHSVFLRVKLSLIVIFLEHQLCYRRSKTQRVLLRRKNFASAVNFEFERLWAHVCVCARVSLGMCVGALVRGSICAVLVCLPGCVLARVRAFVFELIIAKSFDF